MPRITVLPANLCAEVPPGELLLRASEKAGVELEAGCFQCWCGTCVVEVTAGMENLSEPSAAELEVLDGWNKDAQVFRLACCVHLLQGEVTINAGRAHDQGGAGSDSRHLPKKPLQEEA
jgi:ferredoxin